jgi:IS30 family transposase
MDPATPNQNDVENNKKKKKELTNSNRKSVILTLQPLFKNGKFPHGVFTKIGKSFGVHSSTVKKIWDTHGHLGENALNEPAANFSNRQNRGRARVYQRDGRLVDAVKALPVSTRCTVRNLATSLKVSKSTVHRFLKKDQILTRQSSAIKPVLTTQ